MTTPCISLLRNMHRSFRSCSLAPWELCRWCRSVKNSRYDLYNGSLICATCNIPDFVLALWYDCTITIRCDAMHALFTALPARDVKSCTYALYSGENDLCDLYLDSNRLGPSGCESTVFGALPTHRHVTTCTWHR